MTTLPDLSLDTLVLIADFLKKNHIVRLYLIGSDKLNTKLRAVRHRTFVGSDTYGGLVIDSELVSDLLVSSSDHVETDWCNLRRFEEDLTSPNAVTRALHITGQSREEKAFDVTRINTVMSRMQRLEKLSISGLLISGALQLPSTITSLSLPAMARPNGIDFLRHLPLVHLGVTLPSWSSSSSDESYDWMTKAKWQKSLTSLTMSGHYRNLANVADKIPSNLVQLVVTSLSPWSDHRDIASIVSRQTQLQSLTAGPNWCLSSPLPATLTRLKIWRLIVNVESTTSGYAHVAQLIPPSVTSLSIPSIHLCCEATQSSFSPGKEHHCEFALRLMPQLDLESCLEFACCHYLFTSGIHFDHEPITSAMVSKLKNRGYSERHMYWLYRSDMCSISSGADEHWIRAVFDQGLITRKDMALFLKGRKLSASCSCSCSDHYGTTVKCLEWNLCHHLTVTDTPPPRLSDAAVSNLTRIEVETRWRHRSVIHNFFSAHVFASTRKLVIDLPLDANEKEVFIAFVVGTLHSQRARFPLLESLCFRNWLYWESPIDDKSRDLLADMRLYYVPNTPFFRYSVKTMPVQLPKINWD
jgi:hypothetical protein